MIRILILIAFFNAIFGALTAQEIMSVNWQENLTSNSYIDHIYGIRTDSHGNAITLGAFPFQANLPGQTLYGTTGEYLLTKQDTSGNLIYGINFGAQTYMDAGELEISDDDEITILVNYKGNFYWNDTVLASSPNFTALMMKLDSSLNLLWYVEMPGVKVNFAQLYSEDMIQDENENIYTCIRFIDSIQIDGTIYTNNGTSYGLVMSKFDSLGIHSWTHQYQSGSGLLTKIVLAFHSNVSGVSELIISGNQLSNTLYIDTIPFILDTLPGVFISKLDINGNILESVRVRNVNFIADFAFAENHIFFAGMFHDTIFHNGGFTVPIGTSAFIGELNQNSEIVNCVDLVTSSIQYLTGFNISSKYGFLLYGNYQGILSIQSSAIVQVTSPPNGVFIASFDASFTLNEAKYVPATYFILKEIAIKDSLIYGTGIFENALEFANSNNNSWNEDIIVFRVNDLNQLNTFENLSLEENINEHHKIYLYPNPAQDIIQFSGLKDLKNLSVAIYSLMGKLIIETEIKENSISISDLPSGIYYLKMEGISFETLRFVKE